MNYTELVAAAKSYADRNDIEVSDNIDTFIIMAESRINRVLRTYEQTHRIFTTTILGQEFYALPRDYNGMRVIQYNDGQVDGEGSKSHPMKMLSPEMMVEIQSKPAESLDDYYYTIVGQQIQVHPTLPASGTLEILFYRKVPTLSIVDQSNWCSENHPDIYLSGIIAEIELFVKNYDTAQMWDVRMTRAIKELHGSDIDKRWAGNPMVMRVE